MYHVNPCLGILCQNQFNYHSLQLYTVQKCIMSNRGVIVKALASGIVVGEFELQSRYYVHFRTNTLRKGINPLILPSRG